MQLLFILGVGIPPHYTHSHRVCAADLGHSQVTAGLGPDEVYKQIKTRTARGRQKTCSSASALASSPGQSSPGLSLSLDSNINTAGSEMTVSIFSSISKNSFY